MLSKSSAPAVADKSAVAVPENNTRVVLARSMASAGARAYNGDLGAEPPAGSRGRASAGHSPAHNTIFTARCYASAVLAMGLCLSVCVCHKSEFY